MMIYQKHLSLNLSNENIFLTTYLLEIYVQCLETYSLLILVSKIYTIITLIFKIIKFLPVKYNDLHSMAAFCSLEKCKSKPQWDITSHWSEWPSSKCLQTINAEEGVHTCGNVNWFRHYGRRYGYLNKVTNYKIIIFPPGLLKLSLIIKN